MLLFRLLDGFLSEPEQCEVFRELFGSSLNGALDPILIRRKMAVAVDLPIFGTEELARLMALLQQQVETGGAEGVATFGQEARD